MVREKSWRTSGHISSMLGAKEVGPYLCHWCFKGFACLCVLESRQLAFFLQSGLSTFELSCRPFDRFPWQDPYSSKDLAHIMLATCLIMANQLTHPFLELLKICHAYMQGSWPVSFSLGFEPLDPWSTVAQTLGPSSKPCLDPNSTTNGFSCIIVCQNIIFEM